MSRHGEGLAAGSLRLRRPCPNKERSLLNLAPDFLWLNCQIKVQPGLWRETPAFLSEQHPLTANRSHRSQWQWEKSMPLKNLWVSWKRKATFAVSPPPPSLQPFVLRAEGMHPSPKRRKCRFKCHGSLFGTPFCFLSIAFSIYNSC